MRITLATLQAEVVKYFHSQAPEALACDTFQSVRELCDRGPLVGSATERIAALADILTTLLWAARETGLADPRAYNINLSSPVNAGRKLRLDAQETPNADTAARCLADFFELLRLCGIWQSQVKAVAWRRLQAKAVH